MPADAGAGGPPGATCHASLLSQEQASSVRAICPCRGTLISLSQALHVTTE